MSTTCFVAHHAREEVEIDPVRTAACTVVAEVAYPAPGGLVEAAVVHPLVHDGTVVLALPFSRRPLADALAAARCVVLVSSDQRVVLRGWEPAAATGRVRLQADLHGRWFTEELLADELRKYPPSRLLADSLMQQREHWWYLPRLVCRLDAVEWTGHVGARDDPAATGVLAWDAPVGLRAETVEVEDLGDERITLRSIAGARLSGAGDPACLLMHDFSVPDLEERAQLVVQGRLEGDQLAVESRRGSITLPEPAGLLARYRASRAFARACRREIARARREDGALPAPV